MAEKIVLPPEDRSVPEGWLRAPTLAQAMALRAKIVLAAAEGEAVRTTARRLATTMPTVCTWRRRYQEAGLAGLQSRPMSGRPKRLTPADEQAVVAKTMREPEARTHWSASRLAAEMGLSQSTVLRIWRKHGLQPHRVETFKFSKDPQFATKMADVVGLAWGRADRRLVAAIERLLAASDSE